MAEYNAFGCCISKDIPPPKKGTPDLRGEEDTKRREMEDTMIGYDTKSVVTDNADTIPDNQYYILHDKFEIVVTKILVLSFQILCIVGILYFVLSLTYDIVVKLRFVAQNWAAEIVPFFFYFLSIVGIIFAVYFVGRFTLHYFFS